MPSAIVLLLLSFFSEGDYTPPHREVIDSLLVYEGYFRYNLRLFDVDSNFAAGCTTKRCYADIVRRIKIGRNEYFLLRSRHEQNSKVYFISKKGKQFHIEGAFKSLPDSFYALRKMPRLVWMVDLPNNERLRYYARKEKFMYLISPSEFLRENPSSIGDSVGKQNRDIIHSQLKIDSIAQWNQSCSYLKALATPLYCLDFVEYRYMHSP